MTSINIPLRSGYAYIKGSKVFKCLGFGSNYTGNVTSCIFSLHELYSRNNFNSTKMLFDAKEEAESLMAKVSKKKQLQGFSLVKIDLNMTMSNT